MKMSVLCICWYNILSNIHIPITPKLSQVVFWLVSQQQLIMSPEPRKHWILSWHDQQNQTKAKQIYLFSLDWQETKPSNWPNRAETHFIVQYFNNLFIPILQVLLQTVLQVQLDTRLLNSDQKYFKSRVPLK